MELYFENQGMHTYLVYEITSDNIDSMGLGMLTNNQVAGFAPVSYTQMDSSKFIKYNVSAKVSVRQFLSGVVTRRQFVSVLEGIINAFLSAEDYMLDGNAILLDQDYIFTDVSTYETFLIYVPIVDSESQGDDLTLFLKKMLFTTQFDQSENCDYVAKIINYLNANLIVSLTDFKRLLDEISGNMQGTSGGMNMGGERKPAQNSKTSTDAASMSENKGFVVNSSPRPMPGGMNAQSASSSMSPSSQQSAFGVASPQQGVSASSSMQQEAAVMTPNRQSASASASGQQGTFMEIPGGGSLQKPETKSGKKKKKSPSESQDNADANEKTISWFYLMQHYNKENAAAYKAQKEKKKQKKAAGNSNENMDYAIPGQGNSNTPQQNTASNQTMWQQPAASQMGMPNNGNLNNGSFNNGNFNNGNPNNGNLNNGNQNYEIPKATQEPNFGGTIVLNPQTTVLNRKENHSSEGPYLLRKKNSEKIIINKPIFHIGKEKSYADYFIADNSAISRRHASIFTRNAEYFLTDTDSTNHTFVNGNMIPSNSEIKLNHGDLVSFANEDFEFRLY